jgi:hypothetical protein
MESRHRRDHLIADPVHRGKFTFRVFSFITTAIPRFALIRWILLMPVTLLPEYRR